MKADLERLVAWLLWLRRHAAAGPWRRYVDLLPQASGNGSPAGCECSPFQIRPPLGPPSQPTGLVLAARRAALQGEAAPALPLSWTDAELRELQSPGLEAAARHHRRWCERLHER